MGFYRSLQPARNRAPLRQAVADILCLEDVSARVRREADPFGVDDTCPVNPDGHRTISSCGEVVCWHCAKIFWS